MKSDCTATQHSDQMSCRYGLAWDMNDPEPPQCHTSGKCPRGGEVDMSRMSTEVKLELPVEDASGFADIAGKEYVYRTTPTTHDEVSVGKSAQPIDAPLSRFLPLIESDVVRRWPCMGVRCGIYLVEQAKVMRILVVDTHTGVVTKQNRLYTLYSMDGNPLMRVLSIGKNGGRTLEVAYPMRGDGWSGYQYLERT